MTRITGPFLVVAVFAATSFSDAAEKAPSGAAISFKKTRLDDKFRAEGVAVGDFNHDGKTDIAHGEAYYAAPDWKPHAVREELREFEPLKYSQCFQAWSDDFNADGWADLMVVEYPGQATVWLENPQGAERPWARHVIVDVTNNESPEYLDVDGDGRRELLAGTAPTPKDADGPEKYVAALRPTADPTAPWSVQPISARGVDMARKFYHGIGVGDINGDGRGDVVTPSGWWEGPASPGDGGEWKFHAAKLGDACAQMYVYDFDGDGDADVLSSAAHQIGIWWHEQTPDGWQTHEIDRTFSQTHALCFVDMNGDGLMDFVTGKRYWAHGPNKDVNPGDPAVLYWYELTRQGGKPMWKPHQIDDDSGVGTQFTVADVNGDQLLDIAIANKKGVFYFEQVRK